MMCFSWGVANSWSQKSKGKFHSYATLSALGLGKPGRKLDPLKVLLGVEPKIGGFYHPKMDGENNGKPHEQMDEGFSHPYFWKHPVFLLNMGIF